MRNPFRRARILRSEEGMMIVQVALMSGILLAIILSGYKAVHTTIQSANSAASSTSFQDLMLRIQQNLATSNDCLRRLGAPGGLSAAQSQTLTQSPPGFIPVPVLRRDGQPLTQVEVAGVIGSPEFKITAIRLGGFSPRGRSPAQVSASYGGYQPTDWYVGKLYITAQRRTQIMGATDLSGSIDLFFQVKNPGTATAQVLNCSLRNAYQVELGPPAVSPKKSGQECVDRGGAPVLRAGADWYICRFATRIALRDCNSTNNTVFGSTHPDGWTCDPSISTPEVSYAY